ncbi:ATP-binding protein [Desulfuromonas acetoxidans]|uniref:ORC1/DEAH AAA+ ATPase domain-containing protein n=1 Tax=Desulfuromonas acetoxidans (strain DSM 684 / 11070) TaxID=281689 RepID=Q1JXN4_DESA6|nr:AAA family ATPase [Desulfuromonas acetoxidans]EAT14928.1 hypothetical protein Dace_0706 [Desulfuromonas acetoxidans DSM 684]MBF0644729.1 ATP-binding protein [Desulfuromonas acetoxidans]NVD25270.1 ATP-binding protein [Desulfuromonas acetoxidans]NVE17326.1 ATP-binding protein [Desulfuromonas acetoxidans]
MIFSRPKITEVFTPRRAEVNPKMYVNRPFHEKTLKRSVDGSLHTIISGESGNGKSWLYKKVALDQNWKVFPGNFSNAARLGSLTAEIFNAIVPKGSKEWIAHEETINAELSALVAKGGANAKRSYSIKTAELLEKSFEVGRREAGNRTAVLVLDNLEAIFTKKELMTELGNILLLLDDERYAQHKIKILIVGVPANIVEYYQSIENLEPIGNRVEELFHVQSLKEEQVKIFLIKGFQEQLKVKLSDTALDEWSKHIYKSTLGIAQRLHEYCERLSYIIEDNGWEIPSHILDDADWEFSASSLYKAYSVVDKCMNERETRTARRNQVLYALGCIDQTSFDYSLVEKIVRQEFPKTTKGVSLGISQILSDLSKSEMHLLRKTAKGNAYRFTDPKYLMCIRLMLVIDKEKETISKKHLKR